MQIEVRKADMGKEKKRLKVCAYARVSTEASEQENSLENQVSHYTEMIQSNPAYEFAGVYADFGISGFKESRPQFQKMMQDAKNGKIDLIITKSVSQSAQIFFRRLLHPYKSPIPFLTYYISSCIGSVHSLHFPKLPERKILLLSPSNTTPLSFHNKQF